MQIRADLRCHLLSHSKSNLPNKEYPRKIPVELYKCNVLPMVWRVTNEPVDCRPSRGTNKHTQDRKKCSLLDNSTATPIIRQCTR